MTRKVPFTIPMDLTCTGSSYDPKKEGGYQYDYDFVPTNHDGDNHDGDKNSSSASPVGAWFQISNQAGPHVFEVGRRYLVAVSFEDYEE